MSDLLTRAEYAAIAESLDPPAAPFIDGRFRAGSGGEMPVVNPATGATLTTIAAAGAEDVDLAVRRAREAFERERGHETVAPASEGGGLSEEARERLRAIVRDA